MGIKLINEVMDYAGDLTLPEWKALIILAEDANDGTRLTWNPTTSKKIMSRVKLTPHAWTNLRGDLVRKGLLEVAESGRRGHCAKYRFAERLANGVPAADDPGQIGPLPEDETRPMGPLSEDANAEYVLQGVTPTPHCSSGDQAPSDRSAVAEPPADAVASSSANAVAFAARHGGDAKATTKNQNAASNPRKQRVTYYNSSDDVDTANHKIYDAINAMPDDEAAALMRDFRRMRPGIARDRWADAENQLAEEGIELVDRRVRNLALKYGVQHYGPKWPWFVVPASMRPETAPSVQEQQAEPPPWAA
jgi:hypothetical protein